MRLRLPYSLLGAAAIWTVAAPLWFAAPAHAFTFEDKDAAGQYAVPKFDLEEQSKNFRKDGASGVGSTAYETPIGKLQFGVTQGPASSFGSAFSPGGFGPDNSAAQRRHFDRMLAPPTSLDYDNSR
jgi:hypothetical protein